MYVNPFINVCSRFYNWFIWIGTHLQSLFLLLIRIIWGHQFIVSGWAKLFTPEKAIQFFATLGLAPAYVYLVGLTEFIFGILILVGFASRLSAIPLIITMIAAIGLAHNHVFSDLHFIIDPSILVTQTPFPFLIASFIILIFGPGKVSIDGWIKRLSRNWPQY